MQDTTKGQGSGGIQVIARSEPGVILEIVDDRMGKVAPQIVNRSVGATRRAMGKSKRGWGI